MNGITYTDHVYNRKTMAYEPKGLGRSHETKKQIADERDSLCVKLVEAKRQRDRGLNHASELAKALRGLMSNDFAHGTISKRDVYRAEALEALAEWSRYSMALREIVVCTQPYYESEVQS